MREKIKDYDRLLHIQESIDNVFEFMKILHICRLIIT